MIWIFGPCLTCILNYQKKFSCNLKSEVIVRIGLRRRVIIIHQKPQWTPNGAYKEKPKNIFSEIFIILDSSRGPSRGLILFPMTNSDFTQQADS